MKKMGKKYIKIITISGIICFAVLFIYIAGIPKNQKFSDTQVYAKPMEQKFENNLIVFPTDREESYYKNQSESVDNYNEILKAFKDSNTNICNLNQKQRIKNEKYPDYYGGSLY